MLVRVLLGWQGHRRIVSGVVVGTLLGLLRMGYTLIEGGRSSICRWWSGRATGAYVEGLPYEWYRSSFPESRYNYKKKGLDRKWLTTHSIPGTSCFLRVKDITWRWCHMRGVPVTFRFMRWPTRLDMLTTVRPIGDRALKYDSKSSSMSGTVLLLSWTRRLVKANTSWIHWLALFDEKM